MKSGTLTLKNIMKELDFLKKTTINQWNIRKKYLQLFPTKLTKKIHDPCNAKKHYQSFLRNKNIKLFKKSKTIIYHPKFFENSSMVYRKPVLTNNIQKFHINYPWLKDRLKK